jgi:hypothetical protein
MEQAPTIVIEDDIPIIETRGRPVSPEYANLVKMKVGQSFTSKKTRDSLYQIARNLRIRVTILPAGPDEGWRVWKKGERITAPPAEALSPSPTKRKRLKKRAIAK